MKFLAVFLVVCLFSLSASSSSSSGQWFGHRRHHHSVKPKPKPASDCSDCGCAGRKCPAAPNADTCGENETFESCPNYCAFDPTCDSVFFATGVATCTPAIAPTGWACTPRCRCKNGTVRKNGKCVNLECCCNDVNKVLVGCSASCDKNCFGANVTPCLNNSNGCVGNACRCKVGYVQNHDGKCVLPNACSCASPNEVFNACAGAGCPPEKSCANYFDGAALGALSNTPRCECKPGFVRIAGDCKPLDDCCAASANTRAVSCSNPSLCDTKCPTNTNTYCPPQKCGQSGVTNACVCKAGYKRDSAGVCINTC